MATKRVTRSKTAAKVRPALDTRDQERRIGFLLRLAQIAVIKDLSKSLKALGLRPSDMAVMRLIGNNPGVNQRSLSEALYILRPNMVTLIDQLQRRGLVSRASDPNNRRSNSLTLTTAGKKLLVKSEAVDNRHSQRCIKAVGEPALAAVTAALRRLAQLSGRSG